MSLMVFEIGILLFYIVHKLGAFESLYGMIVALVVLMIGFILEMVKGFYKGGK